MRQCIICGSIPTKMIKRVGSSKIIECNTCDIAQTDSVNNKDLYKRTDVYNLRNYQCVKKLQCSKFNKLIQNLGKFIKKGRILDVGAGFGLFAHLLARRKSFHIEIIEPNLIPSFAQKNKTIKKNYKTYDDFLRTNKREFDCVCFIDVLEHFVNPQVMLQETKEILGKHGLILIQLPNYKSLMTRVCPNWSWWMVEDHRWHFSPRSIKLLLEKCGYEILSLKTYETWYDFKKNLDGNFTRKMSKAMFLTIFIPLYFMLRSFFWNLGYGGLLYLIAQKNE